VITQPKSLILKGLSCVRLCCFHLIATMNKLWLEEKEEERSGASGTGDSRIRRGTTRAGTPITGAGSAFASR